MIDQPAYWYILSNDLIFFEVTIHAMAGTININDDNCNNV